MVQSICQDDLSTTLTPILDTMAPHFSGDCLPKPLARQANGKVACDLIWQLPATAAAGSPTPTRCDQLPFLEQAGGARAAKNERGGQNCLLKQLGVANKSLNIGEGWYYDDFSADAERQCPHSQLHRIAFSANATPPYAVQVVLDCAANAVAE